jgi:hypothetical protein
MDAVTILPRTTIPASPIRIVPSRQKARLDRHPASPVSYRTRLDLTDIARSDPIRT